jgi:FkbM family methyltransferase
LIVNTRRLFCRLLETFAVDAVCDVGSMDGADALRFRRVLPGAAVLALEPNPHNFALMEGDERLRRARIRVLPLAASDRSATAPFFVVDANYARGRDLARRGMSSLYERADWTRLQSVIRVPTVRLDELVAAELPGAASLAFWIDVEGKAFEVLRGGSHAYSATRMIHVEVETQPIIGAGQQLFADVERLLLDAGFTLLATDQRPDVLQLNALFVRSADLAAKKAEIFRYARYEAVRRRVTSKLVRLLPMRARVALGRRLFETRCR